MTGTLCLALAAGLISNVELRGGLLVEAPIVGISGAGIEVGGAEPRTLSWDTVKLVTGEHAAHASEFASLAEQAWRARTRLERGDLALAAPLFEELFTNYPEAEGPTRLVIVQGTLRCRLADLNNPAAVAPWLAAAALIEHGGESGHTDANAIDPQTLLAPALPPVFLATPELLQAVQEWPQAETTSRAGLLRSLYIAAAQASAGGVEGAQAVPGATPGDLVSEMVTAMHGPADAREAARLRLREGLATDADTWREAWRRAALARSLLSETDTALRTQGMLEWLHLPARFSASQPYLAGLALAEVSLELLRQGDAAGAASLERGLREMMPWHPALPWLTEETRRAREAAAATTNPEHAP